MSNLPPQGPSSGPGNFVAGLPPPVEEDERPFIGVPSNYVVPGDPSQIFTKPSAAFPQRPRYFAGDEVAPGSWGGEAIVELQLALEAAGLLEPPYQKGVYDAETKKAYATLLAHANYNATSSDAALFDLQERVKQYGKTATSQTRQPLVISITNPEQIAELASQVAVRTIGRRLSSEEASRYAQAYNELERSYQRSRYEMSGSGLPGGEGGEVTDPGSAATFTETQIRQNNPEEVSQQNYRNNFNSFLSLLNRDFG